MLHSVESSEHNSDEGKNQHVTDTEQLYVTKDSASSFVGETEKQDKSLEVFFNLLTATRFWRFTNACAFILTENSFWFVW